MDDRFENLPDWQQRFVIEYEELADRAEKLHAILTKYDAGGAGFYATDAYRGAPRSIIGYVCLHGNPGRAGRV